MSAYHLLKIIFGRFVGLLKRTFPAREFHYRVNGRIRYFTLTRSVQVGSALFGLLLLGWMGFATYWFASYNHVLKNRDEKIAGAHSVQRQMMRDVRQHSDDLKTITQDLEKNREVLAGLARISSRSPLSKQAKIEWERLVKSQVILQTKLQALSKSWTALTQRETKTDETMRFVASTEYHYLAEEHKEAASERDHLKSQVSDLQAELKRTIAAQRKQLAAVRRKSLNLLAAARRRSDRLAAAEHKRLDGKYKKAMSERDTFKIRVSALKAELRRTIIKQKEELAAVRLKTLNLLASAHRRSDRSDRLIAAEYDRLEGKHKKITSERNVLKNKVSVLQTELKQTIIKQRKQLAAVRLSSLRLVAEARRRSDRLVAAAEKKGRELVAAAKRSSSGVVAEARDKSNKLVADARRRSNVVIAKAEQRSKKLVANARRDSVNLVAAVRRKNYALVAAIALRTEQHIEELENVVSLTGLDSDKLTALVSKNGKGGPETALTSAAHANDKMSVDAARLELRNQRWQLLRKVVRGLPLTAPLDHYRKSSGFGIRRDPFTGRISRHNGLDLAYHYNTPVMATAPGTVVFAGWRGGYGWFVEIDHGMGLRTRYAHLRKLSVVKGDSVAFRQKIGLLGSSGRSSGPHVHYEIVLNGKPQNPMRFILAGKYVYKN